MSTTVTKKRIIKYLNRDFESLKSDLIEHLRVYFPNSIEDFNESSIGMMLLEMSAFIGDNMSFYLDRKFEESFLETAREKKNIFKHAKQLGFKAFGKSSAVGVIDCYLKVPVTQSNAETVPDMRFAGTVKRGAKCKSNAGKTYETLIDVDFSTVDTKNSEFITVGDRDSTTNQPTSYVLRVANVDIKAGETKTTTVDVGAYEAFKKVTIGEDDVLEIISVKDSEGNDWYEVDFLVQDTVFYGSANAGSDSDNVPYIMKLKSVSHRFITDYNFDTNRMSLIFGSGDASSFDGELIPDLGDLALPLYGRDVFTDFSIDPQNFLKTRTLGLAPVSTTLTINYRVGGGLDTNAGAGQIISVADVVFDVGDSTLDSTTVDDVAGTFSVLNPKPIQGGKDELDIDEIRQLVSMVYASQSRAVTIPDFIARSLSMPTKFGSVFRVNACPSSLNKSAIELMVLSRNSLGQVVVPYADLKKNLKTYLSRFRMLTDAIEILDGKIINLSMHFEVLVDEGYIKSEVVANCIDAMIEYFNIEKWQINQPVNLTKIYTVLGLIPGVLSVIKIDFYNRVGTYDNRSYSSTSYNIQKNTKNGILYCEGNSIFEVKFPTKDITGVGK